MFIMLNGSFGIGKSTTAKLVREAIPGSVIYDPELAGFILRRLPPRMLGLSQQPADYQDMALWRLVTRKGARLAHLFASTVIIPMAFTNRQYMDELAASLSSKGDVRRVCLVAPLEVVRERLQRRANAEGRNLTEFELSRSKECVMAHANTIFGTPIDATRPLSQVVDAVVAATSS